MVNENELVPMAGIEKLMELNGQYPDWYKMPELNKNLLNSAWYNTSFDPEKRAANFDASYKEVIQKFFERVKSANITDAQKEECTEYWIHRLHTQAEKYLAAESRCVSWAIVGPAKFPVARMEKRQATAEKALNDYVYTENQMLEGDIFDRYMTSEQKQAKIDLHKWRELNSTIDDFIRHKTKNPLPALGYTYDAWPHLKGQFTTQAKNGVYALCEKVLEALNVHLQNGVKIERNIKILTDILEEYKAKNAHPKENYSILLYGVQMVENYEENRLQLLFDGKPEPEVIAKLKAHAFRWSPKNKAWQRILTADAIRAAHKVLEA